MELKNIAQIIEAILFTTDHPVSIKEIKSVIEGIETQDIKEALDFLKERLSSAERAVTVLEIAGGYQLGTISTLAPWLKKFHHITKKGKLSKPALETLAIIAYRQPITRAEAEAVRGVNVDGVIKTLLERKLIKISGKKAVPGRPILYSTTQNFLQHFGINSVKELPALDELGNKENLVKMTDMSQELNEAMEKDNKTIDGEQETEDRKQKTEDPVIRQDGNGASGEQKIEDGQITEDETNEESPDQESKETREEEHLDSEPAKPSVETPVKKENEDTATETSEDEKLKIEDPVIRQEKNEVSG